MKINVEKERKRKKTRGECHAFQPGVEKRTRTREKKIIRREHLEVISNEDQRCLEMSEELDHFQCFFSYVVFLFIEEGRTRCH